MEIAGTEMEIAGVSFPKRTPPNQQEHYKTKPKGGVIYQATALSEGKRNETYIGLTAGTFNKMF